MITQDGLRALRIDAETWGAPLRDAAGLFEIDTDEREAMWIAQCAHESAGFSTLVENLNYSAGGLMATFGKYFTPPESVAYSRQPERIANRVYASRMGNRDEASGDGWRYRGRGLIQLTGATNYRRAGGALGINLIADPDLLQQPLYAALSAAWFWRDASCNELADRGDFIGITRKINGGLTGLDDRRAWLDKARRAFV